MQLRRTRHPDAPQRPPTRSSVAPSTARESVSGRFLPQQTRLLTRTAAGLCVLLISLTAHAAEMSVKELLASKNKWSEWTDSKHKIQLTGRFKGRAGSRIHLQNTDITFVPERGIRLPDRIPLETRLNLSGYFVETGDDPVFRATYFTTAPSDYEVLHQRLELLEETDASARYQLASDYEEIAEFYDDAPLQTAVDRCRAETFEMQREMYRRDAEALGNLIDPGPGFDIPESTVQEIRFQVLVLRTKQPADSALMDDIRRHLPGSQTPAPEIPDTLMEAFRNDEVEAYETAEATGRRQLERLLYRQLRLQELQATIKADSANALSVASQTAAELPEETAAVRQMESDWADVRLRKTRQLKRRELDQLVELLRRIDRAMEADRALTRWLNRQVELYRDRGYQWQLRLADEFLHAWTRWKKPAHQELGVDYLKRAWTAASKEAPDAVADIEERLSHLGWSRLNNRWMTEDQVRLLPADSTVRAEKAGYVAPGMTMDQVRRIQGVPSRRLRMASSRDVEEIWIYGERGSSRLMIHLRRRTSEPDADAVVTEVRQVSGIR